MASDPSGLLGALIGTTGQGYAGMQQVQQDQQQNQRNQQVIQAGTLQLQAAQQEVAQKAQYDNDVSAYVKNGARPQDLSALISRYPAQYQALKAGWDIKDTAQRQADLTQIGSIHAAISSGSPKLAADQMRARIAAERAAGVPVDFDERILASLEAGDPEAINGIKAWAASQLAAANPEKYAESYSKLGGAGTRGDTHVVTAGGALVDDAGNLLYQAADKPEYRSVAPGETLVALGGGDPASSGQSAGSGRYTGGWTPRERNGGDNPDAAVDNKITGVARTLGVDPSADISSLSPLTIAKALAYGEGGKGSLADRNNNPTNLRVAGGTDYRKFDSPDAALKAAAVQVARNLKRGQTTVQSMIEGLPVGGSGASVGGARVGGARVVAQGAPKPEDAPSGYRWDGGNLVAIPGGPADKGKTGGGKGIPEWAAKRAEPKYDALRGLTAAVSGFRDEFGGHTILGDRSNDLQGLTGLGAEGQRDWWAQFASLDNQIRNGLFGASLTDGEKAAYNRTTVTPRMAPAQIRKNLQTRLNITKAVAARERTFMKAQGYDQDAIDTLLPMSGTERAIGSQPAANPGGFKILRVRPK